jgi:tetratricopeptide (TPR) repeat protein
MPHEVTLPFPWKPWLYSNLARVYVLARDQTKAEQCISVVRSALAEMDPTGLTTPVNYLAENEFELLVGNYERVIAQVDELPPMDKLGVKTYIPDILYSKGRALAGLGNPEMALSILEDGRNKAAELGSRRSLWPILCELSRLYRLAGDIGKADGHYHQALDILHYISEHSQLPGKKVDIFNLPHVKSLVDSAASGSSPEIQQPGHSKRLRRI